MQLKELNPHDRNPRTMSKDKMKALKKSLYEFGDLSGIVVNKLSGKIISGHQRVSVLPPNSVIKLDLIHECRSRTGTIAEGHILIDGERFKYREVEWNESTEYAAMIAANKHSGEWLEDELNALMIDLNEQNYDMELTGFEDFFEQENDPFTENRVTQLDEESDEEYVRNTEKTFEPIHTENRNMNVRYDHKPEDFKSEIKQKFVLIVDCPNESVRESLKLEIQATVQAAGAKIY